MSQIAALVHKKNGPFPISLNRYVLGGDIRARAERVVRDLLPPVYRENSLLPFYYSDLDGVLSQIASMKDEFELVIVPCSQFVESPVTLMRLFGTVTYTPSSRQKPITQLKSYNEIPLCKRGNEWPREGEDDGVFLRIPCAAELSIEPDDGVFVSRWDDALDVFLLRGAKSIWVAGPSTWAKLTEKNIHVTGSVDNLGMHELESIPAALKPKRWILVSHSEAPYREGYLTAPLYSLVPSSKRFSFEGRTHFYWKSSSLFEHAIAHHPEIASGWHSSGPGATFEALQKHIPSSRIKVFLSKQDWTTWLTYETETATKTALHQAHS